MCLLNTLMERPLLCNTGIYQILEIPLQLKIQKIKLCIILIGPSSVKGIYQILDIPTESKTVYNSEGAIIDNTGINQILEIPLQLKIQKIKLCIILIGPSSVTGIYQILDIPTESKTVYNSEGAIIDNTGINQILEIPLQLKIQKIKLCIILIGPSSVTGINQILDIPTESKTVYNSEGAIIDNTGINQLLEIPLQLKIQKIKQCILLTGRSLITQV